MGILQQRGAALSFIRSRNSTAGSSPAPLRKREDMEPSHARRQREVERFRPGIGSHRRHRDGSRSSASGKTTGYGSSKIRENAYCTTSTSSRVMRLTSRRHTWTSCMNTGLTTSTTSIPRSAHRDSTTSRPAARPPAWRPSHTPATGATWAAATCCTSSSREGGGRRSGALSPQCLRPRGEKSSRGADIEVPHSPE